VQFLAILDVSVRWFRLFMVVRYALNATSDRESNDKIWVHFPRE